MAGMLAKLYDPGTDERRPELKTKVDIRLPDFSDSYSEGNSRQSGKRKRYESQTEDNLISTLVVTSWKTKTASKGSPSVQRPWAKKSGKLPLRKQSSFKILPTVKTRMTPPVTKSRNSWLMLLKNDGTRNCLPKKLKVWSKLLWHKVYKSKSRDMESVNCQTEENRLKISNLQQIIRKTTFATLQTTNMLINNSFFPDHINIMAQQVDTIAMLEHVNTQLAQLRRDWNKTITEGRIICHLFYWSTHQ